MLRPFRRQSLLSVLGVLLVLALGGTVAYAVTSGPDHSTRQAAESQYGGDTTTTGTGAGGPPSTVPQGNGNGNGNGNGHGQGNGNGNGNGQGNGQGQGHGNSNVGNARAGAATSPGNLVATSLCGVSASGLKGDVAVIFLSTPKPKYVAWVRQVARAGGKKLPWWAVLREPIDLAKLRAAATGTQFSNLTAAQLPDFSNEIGKQLFNPGALLKAERRAFFSQLHGKLKNVGAIALVHDLKPQLSGAQQQQRLAVFNGLFAGLNSTGLPVSGIETTNVPHTTVPFFTNYQVSTVDDINRTLGREALRQLFSGAQKGNYGVKRPAIAVLPSRLTNATQAAGGNGAGACGAAASRRNVGLLFLSKPKPAYVGYVRDVARMNKSQMPWWAVLREPVDVAKLRAAAAGTQFSNLTAAQLPQFAQEIGRQLFEPGALLKSEKSVMFSEFHGRPTSVAAIAVAHDLTPQLSGVAAQQREAVFQGLFAGMKGTRLPVSGIETTKVPQSTVPFFERFGVSSVDDLNREIGREALHQLFSGAPRGRYGVKKTAQSVLPSLRPVRVP